jgi:hypothetical protein
MTAQDYRWPWQQSRLTNLISCYEALGKTEKEGKHMLALVCPRFPSF